MRRRRYALIRSPAQVAMRLRFVAIVAVVVGVGLPAVAVARPYEVQDLRVISGPSPFAAGCPGAALDETRIAGAEIEPAITVDPANPRNIVATWQQDIGRGAARSDLIGTSGDGGRTWKRVTIPGLTRCTGGNADVATDPWVSAGPDGSVYFSGATIFLSSDPPPAALVASRWRDRGRRWSVPVAFAGRASASNGRWSRPIRGGRATPMSSGGNATP